MSEGVTTATWVHGAIEGSVNGGDGYRWWIENTSSSPSWGRFAALPLSCCKVIRQPRPGSSRTSTTEYGAVLGSLAQYSSLPTGIRHGSDEAITSRGRRTE